MSYLELAWSLVIGLQMAVFSLLGVRKLLIYPDKIALFCLD